MGLCPLDNAQGANGPGNGHPAAAPSPSNFEMQMTPPTPRAGRFLRRQRRAGSSGGQRRGPGVPGLGAAVPAGHAGPAPGRASLSRVLRPWERSASVCVVSARTPSTAAKFAAQSTNGDPRPHPWSKDGCRLLEEAGLGADSSPLASDFRRLTGGQDQPVSEEEKPPTAPILSLLGLPPTRTAPPGAGPGSCASGGVQQEPQGAGSPPRRLGAHPQPSLTSLLGTPGLEPVR